jgi:hypothetical protein
MLQKEIYLICMQLYHIESLPDEFVSRLLRTLANPGAIDHGLPGP